MAPTTSKPPVLQGSDVLNLCSQPGLHRRPVLRVSSVSRRCFARRVWKLASALELAPDRAVSQHRSLRSTIKDQARMHRVRKAESGWPVDLMQQLDASPSQSWRKEVDAEPNLDNSAENTLSAARQESTNEAMSDLLVRLQATASERLVKPADSGWRSSSSDPEVVPALEDAKVTTSQGLSAAREGTNGSITSEPLSSNSENEVTDREQEEVEMQALTSEVGRVGPQIQRRWINPNRTQSGNVDEKRGDKFSSRRQETSAVDRVRESKMWTANSSATVVTAYGGSEVVHEGQPSTSSVLHQDPPQIKTHPSSPVDVVASLADCLEHRGEKEGSLQLLGKQANFEVELTKRQLDRRRQSHQNASTSSDALRSEETGLPPSLLSTFNLLNRKDLSVQEVVDSLKTREDLDSKAWGALLVQLAWKGNLEAALQCHESLMQEGVKLTVNHQLGLIKAIGHNRQSQHLVLTLKHFREAGTLTTAVVNAFLVAFNKCGEPRRVLLLFQKLGTQFAIDHTTYHEVLKACQELHLWETAVDLLAEMEKTEMWPDVTDYTMGITACARARRWTKALDLLDTMESLGCPCNTAAINSAINACARVGEWRHALRLLCKMPSLGLQPNVVTWSSVITACGQGPASPRVIKQVLNAMLVSGCEPNDFSWTAAIDAFGRQRDWWTAQMCFASIEKQPSPPAWCALISAYGDAGQWTKALAAFESMRKAGIEPDTAHWTAVIRAVGSRKAWLRTQFGRVKAMRTLVQALYMQMKEAGCVPNEVTYTSMIRIHGRSMLWRQALSVFNEALMAAERGECVISVIMFNALAMAYAESGCFNRLWNLVMSDMEKEYGVSPDRITYTILIKACVQNNKGRILSGQVFRKMQECGVKPDGKTFDWLARGYEQTGLEDRAWNVLENMSS